MKHNESAEVEVTKRLFQAETEPCAEEAELVGMPLSTDSPVAIPSSQELSGKDTVHPEQRDQSEGDGASKALLLSQVTIGTKIAVFWLDDDCF